MSKASNSQCSSPASNCNIHNMKEGWAGGVTGTSIILALARLYPCFLFKIHIKNAYFWQYRAFWTHLLCLLERACEECVKYIRAAHLKLIITFLLHRLHLAILRIRWDSQALERINLSLALFGNLLEYLETGCETFIDPQHVGNNVEVAEVLAEGNQEVNLLPRHPCLSQLRQQVGN